MYNSLCAIKLTELFDKRTKNNVLPPTPVHQNMPTNKEEQHY